ncbi:uncharacterized protein LOC123559368 [Mercenaria mercenaria]|uniref:uncharacterized protein LOC123559368 n=1 Tax=Mercenaria mercenaria TaxID=6596 RepID=UPI001E1DA67A|nr:uncharacterized protein LOC123559368 [Mercenaria mercenaria]
MHIFLLGIFRCTCGLCSRMPTFLESGCCEVNDIVKSKMGDLHCITEHEGFIANCLNIHVLEASYYEFVENEGYPLEGQLIHETYRYLAYRRFVRWIFHRLPKKMRKVLPACVVTSIRTKFPSETYCGFKYPTDKRP